MDSHVAYPLRFATSGIDRTFYLRYYDQYLDAKAKILFNTNGITVTISNMIGFTKVEMMGVRY